MQSPPSPSRLTARRSSAAATTRRSGALRLRSGKVEWRSPGYCEQVNSVALSTDGSLLATGSSDLRFAERMPEAEARRIGPGAVRLWDARTGRLLRRLGDPAEQVMAVALSPDGRRVVGGGRDLRWRGRRPPLGGRDRDACLVEPGSLGDGAGRRVRPRRVVARHRQRRRPDQASRLEDGLRHANADRPRGGSDLGRLLQRRPDPRRRRGRRGRLPLGRRNGPAAPDVPAGRGHGSGRFWEANG